MMMWFLTLRPVQWLLVVVLRRFTGGWCFVRKNDRRFVTYGSTDVLGDDRQRPTTMLMDRRAWTLYAVLKNVGNHRAFLACDDFTGRRLACLRVALKPGGTAAVRIGKERASWRLLAIAIVRESRTEGTTIKLVADHVSREEIRRRDLHPDYWL